jgi:sugar/nucleoside kinase (ribokinase family)
VSPPGRVLVVGDVINDVVVRPLASPNRGSDTDSEIVLARGGQGGNQAAWLADRGVAVRLAARVGAADADAQRRSLEASGVETRLVTDESAATGTIVVLLDEAGERSMFTDRGAGARLAAGDLPPTLLEGVSHLHLSGYVLFEAASREAALRLAAEASRRNVPTSLDPASVAGLRRAGRDAFLDWAKDASVIFPNLDEGRFLSGRETAHSVLDTLLAHFHEVALKLGPDGALCGNAAGERAVVAAAGTTVVDSTGAGDAFAAGYLSALLEGRPMAERGRAGVEAAALALGTLGGRPARSRGG